MTPEQVPVKYEPNVPGVDVARRTFMKSFGPIRLFELPTLFDTAIPMRLVLVVVAPMPHTAEDCPAPVANALIYAGEEEAKAVEEVDKSTVCAPSPFAVIWKAKRSKVEVALNGLRIEQITELVASMFWK